MSHTIITLADIYYMGEEGETIRQCHNNTLYDYLELAKEMMTTHKVTKVMITEMHYSSPTGVNTINWVHWYEPMGNTFVRTHKYLL